MCLPPHAGHSCCVPACETKILCGGARCDAHTALRLTCTPQQLKRSRAAGAKQLTLDGVFHSPLGASPASEDGETAGRPW